MIGKASSTSIYWKFHDFVEVSLRIRCINDTVPAAQRINCPQFVDYSECVIQGDGLTSTGYFVCFDHDMEKDNSLEKFDKNNYKVASAAYR
ncbi:unnamed protein product [Ambrosiozyma monospora]|uniref:Unnamed protein product n=1 Tax=Ambrosiozyma monospora TaxID=43982 RepID=A0ACB5TCA2_AMBMO|nr:unnamed protein product [Ambrosiozyma monospora]